MKNKFLLVPALFTLTLAGCGGKEQPTPIEPEETPVDVETDEGKTTVKDAIYKAYLNYSNPQTFKKVNVQAEIKDVNIALDADIIELNKYGENEIDFSLKGFNANVNAFASINDQREVEGKAELSDVKGKVALDLALEQPYEVPVEPEESQEEEQGDEEEPEESPFEGYFVNGEFTIAPLAVNAFFKDGNVYLDYSDDGVRTTIDNSEDLVGQIIQLVKAFKGEDEEEDEVPQQDGEDEEEEESRFLNDMIDEYTGAPARKIYTVAEKEGFIVPEEDYVAPTEEDKAAVKAKIDKFVDETLPTLVLSKMVTFKILRGGSYELGISLNKAKVASLINIIEQLKAAQEAAEIIQQQGLIKRDGESEPEEPEEPTIADMFNEYCEKFDLTAKVVLDKDGLIRNANVSYDIAASVENYEWNLFVVGGTLTASASLSGKINTTFKYNDEVVFDLPADLDTYVCFGKQD